MFVARLARMNIVCAVLLLIAVNTGWAAYTGPASGIINGSADGYRYGDIVLAGLFPIHQNDNSTCGEILDLGIQRQEAMVFAIKTINADNTILPNFTLGFDIRDTCVNQEIALQHSLDFLNVEVGERIQKKRITGVVGAASSQVSIYVANLLRLFEIPQISYASTAGVLSDKSRYDYFFRTVPPDSLQARAMADLVRHHNWTYVSLINTDDAYGTDGIEAFKGELEKLSNRTNLTFCVAAEVKLSLVASADEYDDAINKLFNTDYKNNATVVVIFGQLVTAEGILEAFQRNRKVIPSLQEKCITWIASDAWGDQINPKHYTVAHGMISIIPKKTPYPEFNKYFLSLNPRNNHQNPWFIEYWENVFNCSMNNNSNLQVCDVEHQKLGENYKQNSKVPFTIDAIYAFAYALHKLVKGKHAIDSSGIIAEGDELRKALKGTHFTPLRTDATQLKFDDNGDILGEGYGIYNLQSRGYNNYTYIKVGKWNVLKELELNDDVSIEWNHYFTVPTSICSEACGKGKHPTNIEGESKCCWKCEDCSNREVSNGTVCVKCPVGYIPNKERNRCMEIPPTHLTWNNGLAIFACILCISGIILTVGIAILFLVKWNDSSVKASSRELSFTLLVGLLLCYITPFFYISRPSHITCGIQQFLLGFSFCICYAAILVKTNRLYRIFHLANTNRKNVPMISWKSQLLITAALVLVQCLINGIWLVVVPPAPQYLYTENSVELTCAEASSYRSTIVSLGYNALLLVVGTAYAIRARKIPADFNEVKYINALMIITCIIWLIYIPTNFATNYQIGSHILAIVISATTIMGTLFFPKVYFIFRKEVKAGTIQIPSLQARVNSVISMKSYGISSRTSPQSFHSGFVNTDNQQGNTNPSGNRRMSSISLRSFTLVLPAVPETEDSEVTKIDSVANSSAIILVNMENQTEGTTNENDARIEEGVTLDEQNCDDLQIEDNTTQQLTENDGESKMTASMPVIDDQDSRPRMSTYSNTSKSKSLNHLNVLPGINMTNQPKKKHWNNWSSFMSIVNKRLPIITRSTHNLSISTNNVEPTNDTTKPPDDDQNA